MTAPPANTGHGSDPRAPQGSTRRQRIFIIDDHPIVRFGMAQLLACEPDLEVCGQAEGGQGVAARLRSASPDLVLLDLSLSSGSGIDLLHQLKETWPELRVLVVSTHDERLYGERVIRGGACGYVMKAAPPEQFMNAVRRALQGSMVVSETLAAVLLSTIISGPREPASPLAGLSDRELEIFELIARGSGTRAIAEALHISVKTVESHQFNLRRKLGADSTHHLRHLAYTWSNLRGADPQSGPVTSA
jgi:DNA-binding NarL/FixJ family response regulator